MNEPSQNHPTNKTEQLIDSEQRGGRTWDNLSLNEREMQTLKVAVDQHAIVAETDRRGDITHVNDKFCEISQYSRDELLGQNHRILNSGYHPKFFFINMWRTISSGRIWHNEIRNRRKDGSFYWVETTIIPFIDENSCPYKYVSIRTDITRVKEAELAIADAHEQLLAANRLKSEFLAVVGHELRTPLHAINGVLDLLNSMAQQEEQKRMIALAKNAGDDLNRVLGDILDLSRLESRENDLLHIPFSVAKTINKIATIMGKHAEAKDITIEVNSDAGLHQDVYGDAMRFRQIVTILVNNAIKFTDQGSIRIQSDIRNTDETFMQVFVSVQDTGRGIAERDLTRIFDPFTQGDSALTRVHAGTGTGLSICRCLVEQMHGEIGVNSEQGRGSRFWVLIPFRASV